MSQRRKSSLLPAEEEQTTPVGSQANSYKRPDRIVPEQEYDPALTENTTNDEKLKIEVEKNRYARTTLGTNKLQKVEFDALLEVLSDQYEFNYELLGKMLDDQIKSLSPDNRNAYYDILNRKKNRLDNQILKKKKTK